MRRQRYRDENPRMSLVTLRRLERLANFHVLLAIANDPGDRSPARDMARLAAIRRLELPARQHEAYLRRKAAPVAGGLKPGFVIILPPDEPQG